MNVSDFKIAVRKFWIENYGSYPAGEARVITGIYNTDAMMHAMLVEHGVKMRLAKTPTGRWVFVNYQVVDEKKFMMFVLRWA